MVTHVLKSILLVFDLDDIINRVFVCVKYFWAEALRSVVDIQCIYVNCEFVCVCGLVLVCCVGSVDSCYMYVLILSLCLSC